MGCGASSAAPEKKGYPFRLRLIGGVNLYNNSFGVQLPGTKTSQFNFSGKSDPYVKISIGKENKKSKTILHEQNPVWNEDFYFNCDTSMPIMKIQVFDADALSKDDCIGTAEVNLHGLIRKDKETEFWLPLDGAKANGEIGFNVIECFRTNVTLKQGIDVKAMDGLTKSSDCYCTVQVGQQPKAKSAIKGWTLNPVWNESFTFFVPYGVESQLEMVLYDNDTIGTDNNMGWFYKKLDGKPLAEKKDYESRIAYAQGTLQYAIQDDTEYEVPPPGPVTEEMKKKFPPTAPQTANFTCRVVSAYNLAAADHDYVQDVFDAAAAEVYHEYRENKGTSDPFARLKCEGQVYDTRHINGTLEPNWNEKFRFIAKNKETSELVLELHDHDILVNDCLGKVTLPLNQMKPGEQTEMWSFLDAGRGEVGVELQMNFQLKCRVVSCSDLPAKDMNGMCDPYVKLTVGEQLYQTRVVRDNRAPWIDEDFRWSVPTLKDVVMHIEVWDSDLMIFKKGMSEDLLGMADVPLGDLQHGIPNELEVQLKVSGNDTGKIRLIITDEIPLPPSALALLQEKGKEAFNAAVGKLNETKDFIKKIKDADPDNNQEDEFEVCDRKINDRMRYTRLAVDVVAVRGLTNCTSPLYVGVAAPLQGQRFKTKKEYNDSKNPDIGESFEFRVPTKTVGGLEFTIFESNKHSYTDGWSNTNHAKGFVHFANMNKDQGLIRGSPADDTWIQLDNGGEICVRIYEELRYNVRVIGAEGIKTETDPYVALNFDGAQRQRTNTVPKDPKKDRTDGIPGHPIWNEQFTFFAKQKGLINFKIMDENVISDDKALDSASFDVNELRRGVAVTKEIKLVNGGTLTIWIKEEEKMGLLDAIIDAAANAAKLAAGVAAEVADKAKEAVGDAVGAIGGALGGLFGK